MSLNELIQEQCSAHRARHRTLLNSADYTREALSSYRVHRERTGHTNITRTVKNSREMRALRAKQFVTNVLTGLAQALNTSVSGVGSPLRARHGEAVHSAGCTGVSN